MFGRRRHMELVNDELPRILAHDVEPVLDEYDAMRAVYRTLTGFPEPERRRILEAVENRLRDDDVVRAHARDK